MTHSLFLILKILGIILLVLLILIFLTALLVLFVPVRYRLWGEWKEEQFVRGKVSWLFRLFVFHFSYVRLPQEQEGFSWDFKILGKKIWGGAEQEKDPGEAPGEESFLAGPEEGRSKEELEEKGSSPGSEEGRLKEEPEEKESSPSPEERSREEEAAEQKQKDAQSPRAASDKGPGFWQKLGKGKERFQRLRFSFQSVCDKLKSIRDSLSEKWEWLQNEKNQASLRLLWRQLERLCRHICPGKGMISLTFGFEDPYTTGQVLEAASLIYPFCHNHLSLYPVFDEPVLEAEGSVRGRIRLSFLLWLVLQVLFDKHTRRLLLGLRKK